MVAKLKPKEEWRPDEEWGEEVAAPGSAVALRGMERGSLNSWEAQVSTPVREERRPWACMGRLEPKSLHEAESLEGLLCSAKGTIYPPVQGALSSLWREEKSFLGKF